MCGASVSLVEFVKERGRPSSPVNVYIGKTVVLTLLTFMCTQNQHTLHWLMLWLTQEWPWAKPWLQSRLYNSLCPCMSWCFVVQSVCVFCLSSDYE